MKNRIRTFIAVSLSPSVLSGIEKLMRTLRTNVEDVRWVEAHHLHVTLKFLGDIPLNELPQLIRAVTHSTSRIDSFDLTFQGFGAFPNRESPKTIWIGCREGSENLIQLAARIDEGLFSIGYPKETKRFSPHLTIGRVKKPVPGLTAIVDEQRDRLFGSCSISEVQIVSSELTRRGPIYDELAVIPLR
ncbi:MAG: RNA 2',3'-cyclic phosphodiesterase [Planctomycetaceae bacterium]|nr:RNA 2',3'-cyclic phosphodiesterase [Planctomycetaceae bacterium]